MPTYARIEAGAVAELVTTGGNIRALYHPDIEWVDLTPFRPEPQVGWLYRGGAFAPPPDPPPPPPPTPAEQGAAAFAAGCQIISAGTPALSGRYALDPASQAAVVAVQTRINAGLGLPLGATTIAWPDMGGTVHTLTAAQFTVLAAELSDYVYLVDQFAAGLAPSLPPQPYPIP